MTRQSPLDLPIDRRRFLRGSLTAAGLLAAGGALAGCSGTDYSTTVTIGSRLSDKNAKAGLVDVVNLFTQASSKKVSVNTVDSTSFQENLNNYLQGTPDDVITWMSGYRLRYFADKDLIDDVSSVWRANPNSFNASFKDASTADDGKQYLIPFFYYPWGIFYRKSLWAAKGYEVPTTFDQLIALSKKMKADGITPIGFGARDGWPPFGTFDYLNLRLNGVDFHRDLLAGQYAWTDKRVTPVFDAWRELITYQQPQPLGRKISESQQALLNKEVGMMVVGLFVAQSFPEGPDREDLDFFPFPEMDSAIGMGAVEAPMDGLMMRKGPRNRAGAEAFLNFLTTAAPAVAYARKDPQAVPAHKDADLTEFPALVQKSAQLVAKATAVTQYLDRDTRPDFASIVMIPAMQQFLGNPRDVKGVLRDIERQKKSVFGT
ncbi:ABC transporter substrate-binding protein [Williamsia sp. CHRR-6]|uniref:ABC transporter substrate-binding protein n=1 Tax=Williamsia sp. CHRR-6 TaxID=2835871 RepID=UPI001BDADBA8|nr:extracellular solute-binding protein [Williamsia sp. CHRR-6]MBT0567061.1 extracellular solute-binding protein [Williamsia sp. CHRR-6]